MKSKYVVESAALLAAWKDSAEGVTITSFSPHVQKKIAVNMWKYIRRNLKSMVKMRYPYSDTYVMRGEETVCYMKEHFIYLIQNEIPEIEFDWCCECILCENFNCEDCPLKGCSFTSDFKESAYYTVVRYSNGDDVPYSKASAACNKIIKVIESVDDCDIYPYSYGKEEEE